LLPAFAPPEITARAVAQESSAANAAAKRAKRDEAYVAPTVRIALCLHLVCPSRPNVGPSLPQEPEAGLPRRKKAGAAAAPAGPTSDAKAVAAKLKQQGEKARATGSRGEPATASDHVLVERKPKKQKPTKAG
jgi:hypothetical protein